jgi:hypothetical protein
MISAIFGISTLKHGSFENDVDLDSILEAMSPNPSQAPKIISPTATAPRRGHGPAPLTHMRALWQRSVLAVPIGPGRAVLPRRARPLRQLFHAQVPHRVGRLAVELAALRLSVGAGPVTPVGRRQKLKQL